MVCWAGAVDADSLYAHAKEETKKGLVYERM